MSAGDPGSGDSTVKRGSVKTGYIMQVTANEDCQRCLGTGICAKQTFNAMWNKLEIEVSVCACVRVVPRFAGAL